MLKLLIIITMLLFLTCCGDDKALEKCQEKHSLETCLNTLRY